MISFQVFKHLTLCERLEEPLPLPVLELLEAPDLGLPRRLLLRQVGQQLLLVVGHRGRQQRLLRSLLLARALHRQQLLRLLLLKKGDRTCARVSGCLIYTVEPAYKSH